MDDRTELRQNSREVEDEHSSSAELRAERLCGVLYEGAITAVNEGERELFLSLFTGYLSWVLGYRDGVVAELHRRRGVFEAFRYLLRALRHPKTRDGMWKWTLGFLKAAGAKESYKRVLAERVFRPMVQPPLELDDERGVRCLLRFFRLYEDAETRWVVFDAYRSYPDRLASDLECVGAWCEEHDLPPPRYSLTEIMQWRKECLRECGAESPSGMP